MSARMHSILRIVIPGGFLLAAMVLFMANLDRSWWGMGYLLVGFIVGEMAGLWIKRFVPVECLECGDKAYYFTADDDRICFRCSRCGHVEKSAFQESGVDE